LRHCSGIANDWSPLDPIKALFYSAVIAGFVAVPITAAMMLVVSCGSALGKFTAERRQQVFGWAATIIVAAAAIAMLTVQ
jgi:Mn2+/Fe2+ NRAMP family transporter